MHFWRIQTWWRRHFKIDSWRGLWFCWLSFVGNCITICFNRVKSHYTVRRHQFNFLETLPLCKHALLTYISQISNKDTKGVIIIRKSKKNRQHNAQKKKVQKDKQRSTKHTHKTALKTGDELKWSGRWMAAMNMIRCLDKQRTKKTISCYIKQ